MEERIIIPKEYDEVEEDETVLEYDNDKKSYRKAKKKVKKMRLKNDISKHKLDVKKIMKDKGYSDYSFENEKDNSYIFLLYNHKNDRKKEK